MGDFRKSLISRHLDAVRVDMPGNQALTNKMQKSKINACNRLPICENLSMNIPKIVRRNHSKPMALRVATSAIIQRVNSGIAKIRGDGAALLAQIHEEDKEKFDAIASAHMCLARVKRYV